MLTLFVIGFLAAAQPTVEVQTLGGEPVVGTLAELGPQRVVVDSAKGRVSLGVENLVMLSVKRPAAKSSPPASVWVELIDGSTLLGSDWSVQQGQARLRQNDGKVLEMPTQLVNWVRFQPLAEPLAAEWSRVIDAPTTGDLLVARKGLSIDSHKGVLRDVNETTVRFEVDGELLPVKRANVYGLLYFHPRSSPIAESDCRVTDASGSTWAVRGIARNGGVLQGTTPSGVAFRLPLQDLARIDYSQGKIVYLSNLKPESSTWTPFFGMAKEVPALKQFFAPRTDRGLAPGPIELDRRPRAKGLALHSRTELIYRLPGRFRRFKALVGIDDRVQPHGNVRLVLRGDDRVLWEGAVVGSEKAKPLDLDLTGVRRLTILVDYGENLDTADHLDLAEARIVK